MTPGPSGQIADKPGPEADLLVLIVARIGDTLLVTPALRALKQACPRGSLTVLAHRKRIAVLEHLPFIDRLGTISPASARLRGWIGGRRYAMAFVHGHDSPLARYALRVARRVIAFEGTPETDAALVRVPGPPDSIHAVRERLMLAEAAGIGASDLRLAYAVHAEEDAWARRWIAARFSPGERPLVGLQMTSFPTKAHRDWPVACFAEMAVKLAAKHPACAFVVLGDEAAREAAAPLKAALGHRVSMAAGQCTLRRSAALISALDLYVGVDTGPTHIAGALDVPMVGIYHSDYPGRNLAPLDRPRCRVLEQGRGPDGALGVDRVLAEIESVLEEAGH